MAKMYPEYMRPYEKASKEDLMFNALEALDDDYCIFHSVNFDYWGKRKCEDVFQAFHQHQADFIAFHPHKGILIIEGKAGQIKFENGKCIQINGKNKTEKEITPYQQASDIKFDILNAFDEQGLKNLKYKCKLQHAVWFADLTKNDFLAQAKGLEMNLYRTLFFDDLKDHNVLKNNIEKIFSLPEEYEENLFKKKIENNLKYKNWSEKDLSKLYNNPTNLNDEEFLKIKDKIFNPLLVLAGSESTNINSENLRQDLLLYEQKLILNYLDEQNFAIINGAAGTGKTYIACEKAKRHSIAGESVLFLCYNRQLCKQLKESYKNDIDMENVSFYTIDKLSYDLCNKKIDYEQLEHTISNMYEKFPYKHVIIDEGQDFGAKFNEKSYDSKICNVIKTLKDIVLYGGKEGSFYLFYDKNQMIQCKRDSKPPEYIVDADCKLTLYTNCRNTANIAKTSSAIINNKGKLLKNNIDSVKPQMYNSTEYNDNQIEDIENILQQCISNKIEIDQVKLLTVKTIQKSILFKSEKIKKILDDDYDEYPLNIDYENMYQYKYCYKNKEFDFTTCRKFKGLEAKVVILIDVTADIFCGDMNKSVLYVGATRAKNRLYIVSKINKDDWQNIADDLGIQYRKPYTPYTEFKNKLDIDIVKK